MIKDGKFVSTEFPQYEINWGMLDSEDKTKIKAWLTENITSLCSNVMMLHTEIWKQCLQYYSIKYSRTNSQFLCEDCMEKALGRPIHINDLRICPLSEDWAKDHRESL